MSGSGCQICPGPHYCRLCLSAGAGTLGTWSPDGTKIYYQTLFTVSVVNADGTGQQDLATPDGGWFFESGACLPTAWLSSDGKKILYVAGKQGQDQFVTLEIFAMKADGTDRTNLSNTYGSDCSPAWRP
jgi:Tol biopolymer transport system component